MKIKKVFSSVMALGLTLTLASCGGSDSDSINTSEDVQTSKESTDESVDSQEENELDQDAKEDLDNFESQTSNDTLVVGV